MMLPTEPKISPYAYAGFSGISIGVQVAIKNVAPKNVCKNIGENVAKYYGISIEDMIEKSRKRYVKNARQVAMYLMRSKGITFMCIGEYFHRDHTTVIWACDAIQNLIDTEPDFKQEVLNAKLYACGVSKIGNN